MSETVSPKTFLKTVLLARAAKLGLKVVAVDGEVKGILFTRYEVRENEKFCLSVVLFADGLVSYWTREMIILPRLPEPDYCFDAATCDQWLNGWFERTAKRQLKR